MAKTSGTNRKPINQSASKSTVYIDEFLASKSVRPEHAAGFCLKYRARKFRPIEEWETLFKEYTKI